MSSHVAVRKMRLNKLLFIAMVALCLVFMKASADPADEVAIENEGEAVAPGAQAVEAGAEVGETQAAQDVVRSQMATTRGPTRSQTPSKMQKGNKLKIAIVIGLILLLLTVVGVSLGVFVIAPKIKAGKEKKLSEAMKEGLPEGYEFKHQKMGDEKKEKYWLTGPAKLSDDKEKERSGAYEKMTKFKDAKKVGEGYKIPYKTEKQQEEFCKAVGFPKPEKCDNFGKFSSDVVAKLVGNGFGAKLDGQNIVFMELPKGGDDKKDDKKEKSESKKTKQG